jgi:hypothetical protein
MNNGNITNIAVKKKAVTAAIISPFVSKLILS